MSASTALLPKDPQQRDDHPIFLRVCHSPWVSFSQKPLTGLRSLITSYLITAFNVTLRHEIHETDRGNLAFFEFKNLAFLMLVLYHVIAFCWTFMHLHYPHIGSMTPSFTTRIQTFFSPPRQNPTTKNRLWFSIFYSAVNTFPWLALIYWLLAGYYGKATVPVEETFSHGRFTTFIIINRYAVLPLITLIEIFFLSSVKRPEPSYVHVIALAVLIWSYIGWAYAGYFILGKYALFFLDHKDFSWDYIVGACGSFAGVELFVYTVITSLIGFREDISRKSERRDYQRLPQ